MTFNLVWLPARQTGSSTRTKVLLRIMLRDTTACEDDLVKQALSLLPVPIYAEAHRMSAHIVAGDSDANPGRVDRKPRGRIGS